MEEAAARQIQVKSISQPLSRPILETIAGLLVWGQLKAITGLARQVQVFSQAGRLPGRIILGVDG